MVIVQKDKFLVLRVGDADLLFERWQRGALDAMPVEAGPQPELLAARVAGVGEAAGVQGPVLAEVGGCTKPLETIFTLVGPLSGMDPVIRIQ